MRAVPWRHGEAPACRCWTAHGTPEPRMYPHTPHVCLNTVATLGPQTREPAPSGPAPRLLLAGPVRREGGDVCFVQGSPGPMWLCRKLPEILRKYSPVLQGGGRRGMRPARPFSPGRCLPPRPLTSLCRLQLSPTCLATQCLRPGGRPHPSTSALNNQRAKGHPRAPSWAAHPRTLAPGGKVIRVEFAFR